MIIEVEEFQEYRFDLISKNPNKENVYHLKVIMNDRDISDADTMLYTGDCFGQLHIRASFRTFRAIIGKCGKYDFNPTYDVIAYEI